MKIVLATFGSRGDVQPMPALSLALMSAGHNVRLAAPPEKREWVQHLGCSFEPLGDNVTAFIDTLKDAHYQYLEELEAFLDAGPPPVYAGFGSMPKKVKMENVSFIVQAARSAGSRVVIAKFWEEPSEFSRSRDVFFINNYPHLKLFPRMAGVIHHGGAGTTAASAACGVPQIVVPHLLDQYYWGHRVHQSNLGPKPIWRHRMTSRKLSEATREILSNDPMRQRAKTVSGMIDRQNRLDMAVRELLREAPER